MYRKFDSKLKSQVLTIFAGEYFVSSAGEIISTVLGSCIAVCLYDEITGVGGMNHFMLPDESGEKRLHLDGATLQNDELTQKAMRYGITSMEVLIAEMMKAGAARSRLKSKIFGGGKVLKSSATLTSVGDRNIGFTRAFLRTEGIPIVKEDVGDYYGRKIFFLTGKNSIFVKRVEIEPAVAEERRYLEKLEQLRTKKTDITLF